MQRDRTQARSDRESRAITASRGQTNLDFAVGISLFLGVLIFIFLFVPGLLSPFTASAQVQTVTADRAADHLTKSVLGSPHDPHTLRTYCTVQFFNESEACGFTNASLTRQLGLDPAAQNANVTVVGNASSTATGEDRLCWDNGNDSLAAAATCPDGNVSLTRGQSVPTGDETSVTALRVVWLHGKDVTIVVEVW